ncbi:MAG: hypothetical protein ACP5IX_00760 [Patescibacteria group bacterium]
MRKLIVIIIILIVIGGIVYYLSLKGKPAPLPETPIVPAKEGVTGVTPVTSPVTIPTVDPITKLKNDLTIQARVFIERYGTWSNQSNFENFEDLMPFMTDKLKAETQALISEYQKIEKSSYYGLTTNIVSLNLENFIVDEKAEFSASVQQQETKNGQVNILYKTVKLTFVKEGTKWLGDEIVMK